MSPADSITCAIDRDVLNKHTFPKLQDLGLSIFAPLCGRNRGAFVLDTPDAGTYGCASFPRTFADLAGVGCPYIVDSNSIKEKYQDGNITASDAVSLVDLFVKSVYYSTDGVDRNTRACDASGLAKLSCGEPKSLMSETVRAATLAGVLAPAKWATGGNELTLSEASEFYTSHDFADMKDLGLNAVQIPVSLDVFGATGTKQGRKQLLGDLLSLANNASLNAIVVLVASGLDDDGNVKAVTSAASFVKDYPNVVALSLPSSDLTAAARAASTTLPLMMPVSENDLPFLISDDPHIFAAYNVDHLTSIGDIASSNSLDDRMKIYYHETTACQGRSPIEYAACQRGVPAFVVNGFNVAVDNCVDQNEPHFKDYGQCGRFDERIHSNWWHEHRKSFAARQLASFEKGVGWSFDAWKLYHEDDPKSFAVLDSHAKLFALKNVAAAGLFPSLKESGLLPAQHACLNPPANDFVLGDGTLAPSPAPPPDCGNGWWVEEKGKCEYWIPPTPCPTESPVPACGDAAWWSEEGQTCESCPVSLSGKGVALAATSGAVAALVLGAVLVHFLRRGRRDEGYTLVV